MLRSPCAEHGRIGNSSRALGDLTERLRFVFYSLAYEMLEIDPRAYCTPRQELCPDLQPYSEEALLNKSCLVTKWGTVVGKVLAATRRIKTSQATFWTEHGVTDSLETSTIVGSERRGEP